MNRHDKKRVYLDYNIYDKNSKNEVEIEGDNADFLYSVAHVEEYFKAYINCRNENKEQLYKTKETITGISKRGVILNPSDTRIIAKRESFDMCFERIKKYDTTEIVEKNSVAIFESNRENVEEAQKEHPECKYISNISYDEIWSENIIENEISKFPEFYEKYSKVIKLCLLMTYGGESFEIKRGNLPETFVLEKNCLKNNNDFAITEMLVEFLNNVLCKCGYNKDKNQRTTLSGIHDVSHMIYATYCEYFVTNDERLRKRANAIYYYLGKNVKVMNLEQFNDLQKKTCR